MIDFADIEKKKAYEKCHREFQEYLREQQGTEYPRTMSEEELGSWAREKLKSVAAREAREKLEARETRKKVYSSLIWLGVVLAILHAVWWAVFSS